MTNEVLQRAVVIDIHDVECAATVPECTSGQIAVFIEGESAKRIEAALDSALKKELSKR